MREITFEDALSQIAEIRKYDLDLVELCKDFQPIHGHIRATTRRVDSDFDVAKILREQGIKAVLGAKLETDSRKDNVEFENRKLAAIATLLEERGFDGHTSTGGGFLTNEVIFTGYPVQGRSWDVLGSERDFEEDDFNLSFRFSGAEKNLPLGALQDIHILANTTRKGKFSSPHFVGAPQAPYSGRIRTLSDGQIYSPRADGLLKARGVEKGIKAVVLIEQSGELLDRMWEVRVPKAA